MKFSPTTKRRLVKLAIAAYKKRYNDYNFREGSVQTFIPLTESWGAKFKLLSSYFETSQLKTYVNQRRAARYGLGPIALCAFQFSHDGQTIEGYITEIVKEAYPNRSDFFYSEEVVRYPKHFRVVRQLYKLIGWKFGDSHCKNFGEKNGQIICIDFDGVNAETMVNRLGFDRLRLSRGAVRT